jgi:hypothetical protein
MACSGTALLFLLLPKHILDLRGSSFMPFSRVVIKMNQTIRKSKWLTEFSVG